MEIKASATTDRSIVRRTDGPFGTIATDELVPDGTFRPSATKRLQIIQRGHHSPRGRAPNENRNLGQF